MKFNENRSFKEFGRYGHESTTDGMTDCKTKPHPLRGQGLIMYSKALILVLIYSL